MVQTSVWPMPKHIFIVTCWLYLKYFWQYKFVEAHKVSWSNYFGPILKYFVLTYSLKLLQTSKSQIEPIQKSGST